VHPRCLLWTAAGAGPEGQIAGLAYIAMGECLGRQTLVSQRGPIWTETSHALCRQQFGICAVVLNVLIDKGVITQDELRGRFEQAQDAAADSSGGSVAAEALAAIVSYLEPTFRIRS
jgi:hypothetical protein